MSEFLVPAKNQVFIISKCDREELEDLYLRSYDYIIELKTEMNQKDQKMKKMATKLLRMARDQQRATPPERDLEYKETITSLKTENIQLKNNVKQLKTKLLQIKPMTPTQSKSYQNIVSRINTGLVSSSRPSSLSGVPRSQGGVISNYREYERRIRSLNDEMAAKDDKMLDLKIEIENKNQKIKEIEETYTQRITRIQENISDLNKPDFGENIELVTCQKTIQEWKNKCKTLQEQYLSLQRTMLSSQTDSDKFVSEIRRQSEIKSDDDRKISMLQNELRLAASSTAKISELQLQVMSLKQENSILKEANNEFLKSALKQDIDPERDRKEQILRNQISQLESAMKLELETKNNMIKRLSTDKVENSNISQNLYASVKENKELKKKITLLENQIDILTEGREEEIHELSKAFLEANKPAKVDLSFVKKVDDPDLSYSELKETYKKMQVDYAETVAELWKTHEMLMIQHKISKDYQKEIAIINEKLHVQEHHSLAKQGEIKSLLDTKTRKIETLKAQLSDIAYGKKKYTLDDRAMDGTFEYEVEKGQNIFEFHIREGVIAKKKGQDVKNMSYFCIFEFFDFEIVATNVVSGNRPYFDFNVKYLVTLDDFFIDYLRKGTAQVELLESRGTTFKSLGTSKINFKNLLAHSQTSFINSSVTLFDQGGNHVCEIFYSYKMKEPFETSLLQYQERLRALEVVLPSQGSIINLKITIFRCTAVKSNTELIPSLYVMYKFFDFPDHDTAIIKSGSPEFDDSKTFTIPFTSNLDSYLKSNDLVVYVFDDNESDDASYLCVGKIQLVTLARGKVIQGPFQLFRENGTPNGFIDVCLSWDSTKINESVIEPPSEKLPRADVRPMVTQSLQNKEPDKRGPLPEKPIPKVTDDKLPSKSTEKPESGKLESQSLKNVEKSEDFVGTHKSLKKDAEAKRLTEADALVKPKAKEIADEKDFKTQEKASPKKIPKPKKVVETPKLSESDSCQKFKVEESSDKKSSQLQERKTPEIIIKDPENLNKEETLEKQIEEIKLLKESSHDSFEDDGKLSQIENALKEEKRPSSILKMPDPPKKSLMPNMKTEDAKKPKPKRVRISDPKIIMAETTEDFDESFSESRTDYIYEDDFEFSTEEVSENIEKANESDEVIITIHSFLPNQIIMNDPRIMNLFVSYIFLNLPPEETETKFSLAKTNKKLDFNFTKVINVNYSENYENRQNLAVMLIKEDLKSTGIRFVVVSEPESDAEGDCEDLGFCTVNVKDILKNKQDYIEKQFPVINATDEEIGTLILTVKCYDVIATINEELDR